MRRDLIIAAGPGEWRAALVEAGEIVQLFVERGDRKPAGSIHLGRVVRVAKGLDSAFVDIGDPRPGLVPRREAAAAGIALDEGARVVVEVRREAQPDKGARLSTRLSRPGVAGRAATLDPPAQLDPAPGFATALALALPGPPDSITADDPAIVPELRIAFPEAEIAVGAEALPDLDSAFATARAPHHELPDGGIVHIEEARAATLIDVDTGTPEEGSAARAALARNLAAAQAIARQMRLRNLGGGIVVDFVGLEGKGLRDRVCEALGAALETDPAQPRILGWTRLGHIEIVRPRRGRSLSASLGDPATEAAFEALRALQREARAQPAGQWRLNAGSGVAAALRGPASAGLAALEARLRRHIELVESGDANSFAIDRR